MNSTDYERLKAKILEYIRNNLKKSRLQHTFRVAETAVAMAGREGADERRAEIAALLHDCARNLPAERLNSLVDELGLPERYRNNVNLAHSKVVFLADAIEPGRDYPGVEAIRDAAEESLDRGCLKSLEGTIEFLKAADKFIDNDTIEAFNDIKEKIG